jgi:adenylate kinase family enzyme
VKIVCIGAQNTGKSTFIADFIAKYPSFSTPTESYRDMIRAKGLTINQEGTVANQLEIFNFVVNQQRTLPDTNIIMDRCAFDAMVYTKYLLIRNGTNTEADIVTYRAMHAQAYELLAQFDLVFHFPLRGNEHIVIKPDGLRDTDEQYRKDIDYHFWYETGKWLGRSRSRLSNFYWITGTREERINYVLPLRNYDQYPKTV